MPSASAPTAAWSLRARLTASALASGAMRVARPVLTCCGDSDGCASSGPSPIASRMAAIGTSSPNTAGSWRIEAYARSPSRLTRTGWMPACVCWRYSTSSSPRSRATATAVPSDGWPANGISSAGVQIRLR